jgi:hypothetical protein
VKRYAAIMRLPIMSLETACVNHAGLCRAEGGDGVAMDTEKDREREKDRDRERESDSECTSTCTHNHLNRFEKYVLTFFSLYCFLHMFSALPDQLSGSDAAG